MTPALGPGLADASMCLAFDLSGKRLSGNDALKAALEMPMHAAIFRARGDVGAICRTHSPYAVTAGAVWESVPCLHGFSLMTGRRIPVHRQIDLIHDTAMGEVLAATLGTGGALLVRGNGALAVGRNVREAVVRAIYLEEACRIAVQAGQDTAEASAKRLTQEEFDARRLWHENETTRAWDYYRRKFSVRKS